MGRIWMPGVSDGADLDAITAAAWDVLKGKVIVDQDGNPLTGTLELTGSAADSQVLAGKTYYNTDAKTKRTGTMPNQGAVAPPGLNAGGSYTIPAGFHNGQGKVAANSLASQTDANAAAGDILSGKTAWVKGSKVTGTMANKGAVTGSVNCGGTYTIPAGYHNGSGKVTGNSLASQTGVQSGKTAAGAGQVLTGYEAWVNGGRVTGNMANQGAKTAALNCGGSYTIPAGYHNGQGKVTANSLASQTDANAAAGDILTGKTAWVKGIKTTGTLATMAGQTITPSASQQTVNCSGKKMTGNIVINAIPESAYSNYWTKVIKLNTNGVTNNAGPLNFVRDYSKMWTESYDCDGVQEDKFSITNLAFYAYKYSLSNSRIQCVILQNSYGCTFFYWDWDKYSGNTTGSLFLLQGGGTNTYAGTYRIFWRMADNLASTENFYINKTGFCLPLPCNGTFFITIFYR